MPGFLLRKTYASLSALLNNSFYVLFHGHFNKTLIQTNVLLIPLFVEGNSSRAACITKLHYFVVIDSYPAFNSECERWSFDPWKTVQTSQKTSRYYLLNLSVFCFEPKKATFAVCNSCHSQHLCPLKCSDWNFLIQSIDWWTWNETLSDSYLNGTKIFIVQFLVYGRIFWISGIT